MPYEITPELRQELSDWVDRNAPYGYHPVGQTFDAEFVTKWSQRFPVRAWVHLRRLVCDIAGEKGHEVDLWRKQYAECFGDALPKPLEGSLDAVRLVEEVRLEMLWFVFSTAESYLQQQHPQAVAFGEKRMHCVRLLSGIADAAWWLAFFEGSGPFGLPANAESYRGKPTPETVFLDRVHRHMVMEAGADRFQSLLHNLLKTRPHDAVWVLRRAQWDRLATLTPADLMPLLQSKDEAVRLDAMLIAGRIARISGEGLTAAE